MKLIAYKIGADTAVMHYLAADTSAEAISAEIARAGHGAPKWAEITQSEYEAIVAARPKQAAPKAAEPQHPQPLSLPQPSGTGRLALAVALASAALTSGVRAGDYRWHGGSTDFELDGRRMDAPTLLEHAKTVLASPR